jgi:hypothetical protein
MGTGLILAVAVAMTLSLQAGRDIEGDANPVYEACLRIGGDAAECGCVSREARSRFTPVQIEIIAYAMPRLENVGTPQAVVDELGLSFDQILNLRQRARNADSVIRAACGTGLSGR